MRLRTKTADRALAGGITLILIVLGSVGYTAYGITALIPLIAVSTGAILFVQLEAMRRGEAAISRLKKEAVNDFRQVESLLYLVSILRPEPPLPETRDGAASPDFLAKLVELMSARRPSLVLEAGSGVSTLVIGYYLKRLGTGRVVALEHDAVFAKTTRDWIAQHQLEDHASVVDAPLTSSAVSDSMWYDLSTLELEAPIDMLIVDGPPATSGQLNRYPALPALYEHLSAACVILLDDGLRADEAVTAKRWTEEYPDLSAEFLYLEKGAFLLRRHAP